MDVRPDLDDDLAPVSVKEPASASDVREWAARTGRPVGARGHLAKPLVEAFNRAHKKKVFTSKNPWQKVTA